MASNSASGLGPYQSTNLGNQSSEAIMVVHSHVIQQHTSRSLFLCLSLSLSLSLHLDIMCMHTHDAYYIIFFCGTSLASKRHRPYCTIHTYIYIYMYKYIYIYIVAALRSASEQQEHRK